MFAKQKKAAAPSAAAATSDADGVRVRVRDVAHPALGGAAMLRGQKAQEAHVEAAGRDLGQLKGQTHGTHLHHGGGA